MLVCQREKGARRKYLQKRIYSVVSKRDNPRCQRHTGNVKIKYTQKIKLFLVVFLFIFYILYSEGNQEESTSRKGYFQREKDASKSNECSRLLSRENERPIKLLSEKAVALVFPVLLFHSSWVEEKRGRIIKRFSRDKATEKKKLFCLLPSRIKATDTHY